MVVPVLITNCHVSLKLNMGPVTAHISTVSKAKKNTSGLPVQYATAFANLEKNPGPALGMGA